MEVFDALAQPKRREILRQLAAGEQSAGEVASRFSVTQPAISQHLKVLKEAGLVIDQPAGNRRIYRVDADGLGKLRAELDQFWNSTLTAYKAAVEQPAEEVP